MSGEPEVDGVRLAPGSMLYLGCGRTALPLDAAVESSLVLLGGEPFEEEIVMWWNFIGRSHDELVAQREAWNGSGLTHRPERFGTVEDFDGDRLLAPPMPNVRLRPRGRAG